MTLKKNDIIKLKITGISSDGVGIGRAENGMAVFTPLTAIGDTAAVKIVKVSKKLAFGRLEEIFSPSPDRIDTDCPVFNRCGGCSMRHISYERELEIKSNRVFEDIRRIGKTDIPPQPILYSTPDRYRNKAQFPVSVDGDVGFFARRSHRIIPCSDCLLQPEIFAKAAHTVSRWIRENNISIYDETEHSGLLRHLYLRIAAATDEIMVVLVINGNSLPFSKSLIERLREALGNSLKSVQLNINKSDTNVILGDKCVTLYGDDRITDILCGIKVKISALSFYQVNRTMAELLYKKAACYAQPDGAEILDLYCGTGTIGLSMASRAKSVIGVEIVESAVNDAIENARINNIENSRFICGDAAQAAKRLKAEKNHPDVVILDPPRKGCSDELLNTVCNDFSPKRIVYISCDPATLARDTVILSANGYNLAEYTPADLFPRTSHVETAALFVKAKQKQAFGII